MAVSATSSSGMLWSNRPAAPNSMIRISALLTMRTISGLVVGVGELARKRRQQEKWRDEQAAGNRAERRLLLGIAIDAVDDQQDHRGAEQVVVEGAEELRDENRQEAARAQQMGDVLDQDLGTPLITMGQGIASFASAAKRYKRPADAVAAEPADPVADLRGADPGVPAVEAGALRLPHHLRALLRRRHHRLFRRLSRPRAGQHLEARPVPRPHCRQDHGRRRAGHADGQPQGRRGAADHRGFRGHSRARHPAARDHRLGPPRIPRSAQRVDAGQQARQVEDDACSWWRWAR